MLPKELSYFVHKLANSKRKQVRLTPQSSQTVGMNSQFTIRFPENTILDTNNFNLRFNFTLKSPTSGNNSKVFVPAAYKLWRQCVWRLGGQAVSLSNLSNYNQVYHAMKVCTAGEEYVRSHKLQGEQLLIGDDASDALSTRVLYDDYLTSVVSSRRMVCNDWLGLGGRCPVYLDTSVLGTLELVIQTAGTEIMKSQADSGTPNVEWELTGVEATVDIVELPSEYDDVVSAMLSEGGAIQIPFQDIYSTISPSAGSARFNVSSQSLDSVLYAALPAAYNASENMVSTTGDVGSNGTYESPQFRFQLQTAAATPATLANAQNSTAYWRIQNEVYPSYGNVGAIDWLQITNDNCLGHDVAATNLLTAGNSGARLQYSLENYFRNNFVGMMDLTVSGSGYSGERVCSGIDTRNQSSQIELIMNNWFAGNLVLLAGVCTSIVEAQAGQVLTISQ